MQYSTLYDFNTLNFTLSETFEAELKKLHNSGILLIDGTLVQDLPSPMRSRRLRQVCYYHCANCHYSHQSNTRSL